MWPKSDCRVSRHERAVAPDLMEFTSQWSSEASAQRARESPPAAPLRGREAGKGGAAQDQKKRKETAKP